ncbi:hypothetical protein FCU45_07720 [Sulfurimonas crateris]|uniref:Uncharacterized protein n=1 Tax=Sulfurimonas crateris TaxID=2574727 RepID=A0A4U2Z644_9BACT|nr:hypothetical protein [Sulfurimonas crateris]TKI69394.1 hypothetical protein FCU45_07720 [Sulfurimonas crateris]
MISFSKDWNKIVIVAFSAVIIILAFTFAVDIKAKELIDESLAQAIIVFGSAKALNAVISLAQGTEVNLPFLTVAIGEILDPINDLVEQFSLVMLASMTSLGIQKILMGVVISKLYNIILAISLVVLNIWLFFRFKKDERARSLFFKITIVLIFLRFAIPLMGFVNELAYDNFVKPQYNIERLNQHIIKTKDEISRVTNETIAQKEESSFFDKVVEKFDSNYYNKKIEEYKNAADNSSEYVVDLITVFIFQTMLLPLAFLFLLYYFIKEIFNIGKG